MAWWKRRAPGGSPEIPTPPPADLTDEEDEPLRADELVPKGGSWNGHLFDNPTIGLEASLTWGFTFEFEEIVRPSENGIASLQIEWVPLPAIAWTTMAGAYASATTFAEPLEASAYYFMHHRFDAASIAIREQQGPRLLVDASMSGDIDDLGIPEITTSSWLNFEGIYVQLAGRETSDASLDALSRFTDVSGLVARPTEHGVMRFVPEPAGTP